MMASGLELEFLVMPYFFGPAALNLPLLWNRITCPTSTFPKILGMSAGTVLYTYDLCVFTSILTRFSVKYTWKFL